MEREAAEILLKLKAVLLSTDPPFTWASGIRSPIYCDNRLIMSFPEEREKIINYFIEVITEKKLAPEVICGTASSGIPWAAWIARELELPMVYARQNIKKYGAKNQLEGILKPGSKVLVIEDLVSTGGSSVHAAGVVREAEGVVADILSIFTYQLEKADRILEKSKVNLHTITNFNTLIEVAAEKGYLESADREKVLEWSDDPEGWWYTHFME